MLDRLVRREDEKPVLKQIVPLKPADSIEESAKSFYRKYDQ